LIQRVVAAVELALDVFSSELVTLEKLRHGWLVRRWRRRARAIPVA
jgi:hypothetical protein